MAEPSSGAIAVSSGAAAAVLSSLLADGLAQYAILFFMSFWGACVQVACDHRTSRTSAAALTFKAWSLGMVFGSAVALIISAYLHTQYPRLLAMGAFSVAFRGEWLFLKAVERFSKA